MKAIFHIHSSYSFDGSIPPARIVKELQKLGVEFAAITDHETIKGALEAKSICHSECTQESKLNIIIGAEYKTDKGDIIGLFLKEDVISGSRNLQVAGEVISQIKKQGGIVVLPHPHRGHKLDEELINSVDVIEVYNSRSSKIENQKSLELVKRYGKPGIVGSDAHFLQEIPLTEMDFSDSDKSESLQSLKQAILNGDVRIVKTEKSPSYWRILTGFIRLYKTKDPRIIVSWIKKLRGYRIHL